jgi:hypothetical protein
MKLLIMQSSPVSHHFYFSTPFLNTLYLRPSLRARDKMPHPYKTAGDIIVLYILICKFLERGQEGKTF